MEYTPATGLRSARWMASSCVLKRPCTTFPFTICWKALWKLDYKLSTSKLSTHTIHDLSARFIYTSATNLSEQPDLDVAVVTRPAMPRRRTERKKEISFAQIRRRLPDCKDR